MTVRLELPLLLPSTGGDATVARLRSLSIPFADIPHGNDEEPRQYRLEDWIKPSREWQTYYSIWEWPPYCQSSSFRNIVVFYTGVGKVWLDGLEIFTWDLGGEP